MKFKYVMRKGTKLWYTLKILGLLLMSIVLLSLPLTEFYEGVNNDFSITYENVTDNETVDFSIFEEYFHEYNSVGNVTGTLGGINLSNLLILYPCCVTAITSLTMDLIGYLFHDPMSKASTAVFLLLCILLGMAAFLIAVTDSLKNGFATMVVDSICFSAFVVVELIDFIFVMFGQ